MPAFYLWKKVIFRRFRNFFEDRIYCKVYIDSLFDCGNTNCIVYTAPILDRVFGGISCEGEKRQTEPDGRSACLLQTSEGAEQKSAPRCSNIKTVEADTNRDVGVRAFHRPIIQPPTASRRQECVERKSGFVNVVINFYVYLNNNW